MPGGEGGGGAKGPGCFSRERRVGGIMSCYLNNGGQCFVCIFKKNRRD